MVLFALYHICNKCDFDMGDGETRKIYRRAGVQLELCTSDRFETRYCLTHCEKSF
jgi:hypothetical protein